MEMSPPTKTLGCGTTKRKPEEIEIYRAEIEDLLETRKRLPDASETGMPVSPECP